MSPDHALTERWDYWLRVLGVSVAAAVAVTLLLGVPAHGGASVVLAFLHTLVYSLSMGALAGWTVPRVVRRLRDRGAGVVWPGVIVTMLALALAGTLLARGVITLVPASRGAAVPPFTSDLRAVSLVAVAVGVAMTIYETLRNRLETTTAELQARQLEQERAQKLALEARLSSLQSRLRPHFLFNTLNAISALIHDDPAAAERTVERLAALLRFSLDATERRTVPLAEELKIVVDYLEIEKARFGERLTYALDVAPDVQTWPVLPLCTQTLVENSVRHAVAPRRGGGRIRVEARRIDDRLALAVWDDGPGFTAEAIVPGHGLDNLRDRLAARFGERATLAVSRHDGGSLVTLMLPKA